MMKKRNLIVFCIGAAVYSCVFLFSDDVKAGVSEGISVCVNQLLPSLFPSIFCSAFLTETGLPLPIRKLLFFSLKKITGLSQRTAECFLFGATGGYPVGVKTAVRLYQEQRITLFEAQSAALINVHPGVAFSLLVVGKTFASSLHVGAVFWVSVSLANICLAFLLFKARSVKPHEESVVVKTLKTDISSAFLQSVKVAADSVYSVCIWIVLFTSMTYPLQNRIKSDVFTVFLEVTSAARRYTALNNYTLCSFALGFGGLCVFTQLLPELRSINVSPVLFLLCRLFAGAASALITFLFFRAFPLQSFAASGEILPAKLSAYNAAGSFSLLFLCAVFLYPASDPFKEKRC